MAKFTVFGSTGLIGGALVRYLEARGHEVHTPQIRTQSIPIEDLGNVVYCIGVTTDFLSKIDTLVSSHIELASKILKNSSFESFLYISSTRIYEKSFITTETEDIAVSVMGLSNFYNLTKMLGESLVLNQSNNRGRIARLSYVVDDLQLSGTDPVSSVMSQKSGQSVHLSHHSESQKDFILLSEAVDVLINIALHGRNQIYNVASGKNISFNRIKSLAKEYLNVDVELDDDQQVRVNPLIDVEVVRREFNFNLKEIEHYFKEKGPSIHV